MRELLQNIVMSIVDKPDEVKIDFTENEDSIIYEIQLGDGDLGKVIGKKGKNIGAIRTLISAASAKEGSKRSIIEIIE
ncbi:MAG: RNA-binding protein [Candidatus Marinimicrobia bacterium]|nr:RNA-binding protein [Candidatus Neomarinimicrobiota bacterium]|tara:strand:- start:10179 stop:10412 length:234 start_codon:yes stop_codon:yes gene_type:complete